MDRFESSSPVKEKEAGASAIRKQEKQVNPDKDKEKETSGDLVDMHEEKETGKINC